jgi:hypothetical protein
MAIRANGESDSTHPQTFDVNGEQVSEADLEAAYTERARMRADYTQKTQSAADARRQAEATLEEAKSLGSQYQQALAADLEYYNTHPPEEWQAHTPQIDAVLGIETTDIPQIPTTHSNETEDSTMNSAETAALVTDISDIKAALASQEEARVADTTAQKDAALAARVDTVVKAIEVDLPKLYPHADADLVEAKVSAYQLANKGALPSDTDLEAIAKGVHEKFVALGVPVPAGVETRSTDTDLPTGTSPNEPAPAHEKLDLNRDNEAVEDSLQAFINARASANE